MNAKLENSIYALMAKATAGCEQSQGQLLERFRKYLTTLARLQFRRKLRAKTDPSDIVQESFLRAHDKFHQFSGKNERELAAWLRSILATRIANEVRRYEVTQGRQLNLERRIEDSLANSSMSIQRALSDQEATPSELASMKEQTVLLGSAIEDLPDHYRTVILLRNVEGLKYEEIATETGRSIDSVKKIWVRALAQLQECMEQYE